MFNWRKKKVNPPVNFDLKLTQFLTLINVAYDCNVEKLNQWLISFIKETRSKVFDGSKKDYAGILQFFEQLYSEKNRPMKFYEVTIPVTDRVYAWYILKNQHPLPKHTQCTICKSEFDLEVTNGEGVCVPIGTNKYCYSCWVNPENKFDIELRIKR